MMLHRHFRGIFDLVDAHFKEFCQSGRRHTAGGTDLGLATAFRTADGSIGGYNVADQPRHRKGAEDIFVGKIIFILHILQHCGNNTAGAAGRSGNDDAAIGILLADRKSIGANQAVLSGLGAFVDMLLVKQKLRFALHRKTARQGAAFAQAFVDGILHRLPNLHQVVLDVGVLIFKHIVRKSDIFGFANLSDALEGIFLVNVPLVGGAIFIGLNFAAADTIVKLSAQFHLILIGNKFNGIGMNGSFGFVVKDNFVGNI